MTTRHTEQKYVASEVELIEWSPMTDLIALATKQGEIILHRLTWQKVWSISAPNEKDKTVCVTSLAWRPDGKVLAFSYDTGKVLLCDVENSEVLHSFDLPCVTSLNWVGNNTNSDPIKAQRPFYKDRSNLFLPKLPSLSKTYGTANKPVEENVNDSKKLKEQDKLNILAVGTVTGMVHLYAFGIYLCGIIDLNSHFNSLCSQKKILSLCMSEDLSLLSLVVEATIFRYNVNSYNYHLMSFKMPLLIEKMEELKVIALKFGQISSLLSYLSSTISAISEAWEDILLEIDTKLMKYAEEKKRTMEGTISDDFLELLMFGTPSDVLEKFLLHDLTEKGLKKLGHSIELSYSNIQKLVLKHLQNVANALFYHLGDLQGMAMWQERFGDLHLKPESVREALFSVGSFLMKAIEIQQVIDNSMKNFKAFFRWLYCVILRLSEEPLPVEITKVTQQDLNFVAEFLKENFASEWDQDTKSTFKLERVGQYLKNENLSFPPVINCNPWIKFLEDNPAVRESTDIIPYYAEKSLVRQHSELCEKIDAAFGGLSSAFEKSVTVKTNGVLYSVRQGVNMNVSYHSSNSGYIYSTFIIQPPSPHLFIIRESLTRLADVEIIGLSFEKIHTPSDQESALSAQKSCSHKVIDVKFYNEETLSVLLEENENAHFECAHPFLGQLNINELAKEMKPAPELPLSNLDLSHSIINGSAFIDNSSLKKFENISAACLSVNGFRKVVCVLLSSRRQVRLLVMDGEEEDEDVDDTEHEDSIMRDSFDRACSIEKPDDSFTHDTSMAINEGNAT